jgi:hypothetical protein
VAGVVDTVPVGPVLPFALLAQGGHVPWGVTDSSANSGGEHSQQLRHLGQRFWHALIIVVVPTAIVSADGRG